MVIKISYNLKVCWSNKIEQVIQTLPSSTHSESIMSSTNKVEFKNGNS